MCSNLQHIHYGEYGWVVWLVTLVETHWWEPSDWTHVCMIHAVQKQQPIAAAAADARANKKKKCRMLIKHS
jgi:hypothetical protein